MINKTKLTWVNPILEESGFYICNITEDKNLEIRPPISFLNTYLKPARLTPESNLPGKSCKRIFDMKFQ